MTLTDTRLLTIAASVITRRRQSSAQLHCWSWHIGGQTNGTRTGRADQDLLASFLRWHAVSAQRPQAAGLTADAEGRAFHSFPNLCVVLSARGRQ